MATQIANQDRVDREQLYKASIEPRFLRVQCISFLMVDGTGDPNTSAEYQDALAALYGLSYTLKFERKKSAGLSFRVAPLEGLWWADEMREFSIERKGDGKWTAMVAQPDEVTPEMVQAAVEAVRAKKHLQALDRVRLEPFEEGWGAQVLHLGPYAEEGLTIDKLHRYIHEHGYTFDGTHEKHHEIYRSDPRRTAPDRVKTILRQPVVPL